MPSNHERIPIDDKGQRLSSARKDRAINEECRQNVGDHTEKKSASRIGRFFNSFGSEKQAVDLLWDEWMKLPIRDCNNAVHTVRGAIRVPTVIVAVNFANPSGQITIPLRLAFGAVVFNPIF